MEKIFIYLLPDLNGEVKGLGIRQKNPSKIYHCNDYNDLYNIIMILYMTFVSLYDFSPCESP